MAARIKSLDQLFNNTGRGNPNGGKGSIDWMTQNFCAECRHITFKGTKFCPRCHARVRVAPRRVMGIDNRRLYRKAQTEAAARLSKEGWKLPPPSIGARSMFGLNRRDFI